MKGLTELQLKYMKTVGLTEEQIQKAKALWGEDVNLEMFVRPGKTPEHYAGKVTPWDLQKCMKSSGNAFVDARRTDAIEYAFRIKDDLLDDLRKARHCLDEAIKVLESDAGITATEELPTIHEGDPGFLYANDPYYKNH